MIHYFQPLFPPCCVMLVLSLVMGSMVGAVGKRSTQYTVSSKVLTLAILFDLVVCAANVLVPHIPSYLLVDHAVVVIPLLPIETSLVSMAALKLLHRSHYYRFVFRFGVVSGIALMLISVLAAVWQYYADLLNLLGSPESTGWRFTSVLFYVSLLHFAATILINFFVLVSTMLRYRRQINSYFAYREHQHAYVIQFGTGFYCLYLLAMLSCILLFYGVPIMSVFTISMTLIYIKTTFFVLVVCMFIRFHRRYYIMEPALYTLDEIDEKVENKEARVTLSFGNEPLQAPAETATSPEQVAPVAHRRVNENSSSCLSDEAPSVKYRLEQWVENDKKYFLRDDINLLKVAEMIGVSPRLLSGYLNSIKGINFNLYINQLRIDEAQKLIYRHPEKTLTEIAYITGYSSVAIFSRSFKRITGVTPTQFRQMCVDLEA